MVELQVLDEDEEGHLFVGYVELLVCRDCSKGRRLCELPPIRLELPVAGDDLASKADLLRGDSAKGDRARGCSL